MSKELWLAEFERHLGELEESGVPFDQAYEKAGELTERSYPNRLADMVDAERLRRKEGR